MRRAWWPSIVAFGLMGCDGASPLGTAHPMLVLRTTSFDFGAIDEGDDDERSIELINAGPAPLEIALELEAGSSPDFSLDPLHLTVGGGGVGRVTARFKPVGAGSDAASVKITTNDPMTPIAQVRLTGGPIAPDVVVLPNPVDFGPAEGRTVSRVVHVENRGSSALHVSALLVDPAGNQDFSVRGGTHTATLAPNGGLDVALDYVRSHKGTPGQFLVRSDDPDMPELGVRLIPDPLRACEDGLDDDDDGLVDFPDDPGCTSATDDDETNPAECTEGATEPCGNAMGACVPGTRRCAHDLWGPCDGAIGPTPETCNGVDDDCDGRTDEGIDESCVVNGCGGARVCVEGSNVPGGAWSACIPLSPTEEVCDGVDNDCDGEVDEGILESCDVNGCSGQRVCVPGGTGQWSPCQVATSAEVCNGIDDDCDGVPDDNLPALTCGQGVCATSVPACVGGVPQTCVPGPSSAEVCNGLDDDCNGVVDDGFPQITCGQGACRNSVSSCAGGMPATCSPLPAAPRETCGNNIDDDCNGLVDDGCTAVCGLHSTAADPQEPNDAPASARPVVPYGSLGAHTYAYDVTLPVGDTDWLELDFPPAGTGTFAQLTASVTCVSWAGAGCGPSAPRVRLEAWYFDDCAPQQDDADDGSTGLATVSSSGPISSFGLCGTQRFRVHAMPSTTVCPGEALNAHLSISVTWSP